MKLIVAILALVPTLSHAYSFSFSAENEVAQLKVVVADQNYMNRINVRSLVGSDEAYVDFQGSRFRGEPDLSVCVNQRDSFFKPMTKTGAGFETEQYTGMGHIPENHPFVVCLYRNGSLQGAIGGKVLYLED